MDVEVSGQEPLNPAALRAAACRDPARHRGVAVFRASSIAGGATWRGPWLAPLSNASLLSLRNFLEMPVRASACSRQATKRSSLEQPIEAARSTVARSIFAPAPRSRRAPPAIALGDRAVIDGVTRHRPTLRSVLINNRGPRVGGGAMSRTCSSTRLARHAATRSALSPYRLNSARFCSGSCRATWVCSLPHNRQPKPRMPSGTHSPLATNPTVTTLSSVATRRGTLTGKGLHLSPATEFPGGSMFSNQGANRNCQRPHQ